MSTNELILVNENNEPIGKSEKMHAHKKGLCHRAFSIFILRESEQGLETLLQQRAFGKYHSQGLWTNSCCSHPNAEETLQKSAERRLEEEFGFSTTLKEVGVFHYIAHLDNHLIENEMDHVLIGYADPKTITANPEEIAAHLWITLKQLQLELQEKPNLFTAWLAQALNVLMKGLNCPSN